MKPHEIFYQRQYEERQRQLYEEIRRRINDLCPNPRNGEIVNTGLGLFIHTDGKWEVYRQEDPK